MYAAENIHARGAPITEQVVRKRGQGKTKWAPEAAPHGCRTGRRGEDWLTAYVHVWYGWMPG